MTAFTTRPEIQGTFGVATSTHWIASTVGMAILEEGGNAFDAAVAMGFTLQIVEPHLNGPAGDVPIIFHSVRENRQRVLCGQGPAPAGATIARYRHEGLDMIPGAGLLATVIPGAFDAWMQLLRDYGTVSLRRALEPAIHYAEHGHPMLARVSDAIAGMAEHFIEEWPTSAETWLDQGTVPQPGKLFRNERLAETWKRVLTEAEMAPQRELQIERARDCWRKGFIAESVDQYMQQACVMDGTGERRKGVLTGADMALWEATYEEPLKHDYDDWTVVKTGPWGQGPVLAQSLELLKNTDIADMDLLGPDFIHTVIETIKLTYADREAYYGDPEHSVIPMEKLLSPEYAAERAALIGAEASLDHRPGRLDGFTHQADAAIMRAKTLGAAEGGIGGGEPTMAHLASTADTPSEGDTVHIDVIDKWGNMVSATPSGGWLQSSPVIPNLGFPLNSRAQMFWLEEGLPTSLAPGRRPRTTLTPSLALRHHTPYLSFGTPGGDQQDQWQLIFFLRLVHSATQGKPMNLQEAIDAPLFHSQHFTASFYPRQALAGKMMIEPAAGHATIEELRKRGHVIEVSEPWAIGRLTAAAREADGLLRAAATPRLMQAYAIGR